LLRKVLGTIVALVACWWMPEAAACGFLLWLFWDQLTRLGTHAWDDVVCARTARALREDPGARVEGYYVLLLADRRRGERERRERSRQWWRSRMATPRRALAALALALRQHGRDVRDGLLGRMRGTPDGERR
jgi:hypothetical protein